MLITPSVDDHYIGKIDGGVEWGKVSRNAGRASKIAPREYQWSERGFGVELGEDTHHRPPLISRLVFTAN